MINFHCLFLYPVYLSFCDESLSTQESLSLLQSAKMMLKSTQAKIKVKSKYWVYWNEGDIVKLFWYNLI